MGADSIVMNVTNRNCSFENGTVMTDLQRLINQIWKLLPMRENNEDWQKQLNSVLNELYGLRNMFGDQLDFLILLSKLEGLPQADDFMTYRISVFGAISLLTELVKQIDG